MWFFFFFSSRRRHTRYWRDWSSDVCSSDLQSDGGILAFVQDNFLSRHDDRLGISAGGRSEERRVGKECRSRWSPDHSKKKVEPDDVVGNVAYGFIRGGIVALPHAFHLNIPEVTLHHCVVPAIAFSAHAVFFFSSRRRHTMYWRDWSSDVCSSDLEPVGFGSSREALEAMRAQPRRFDAVVSDE